MKGKDNSPLKAREDYSEIAESLLIYPSLEKLFDPVQVQDQTSLKDNMKSTITELERIVLRGSKAEAEKAARIIKAYNITLNFLDELEDLRQGGE